MRLLYRHLHGITFLIDLSDVALSGTYSHLLNTVWLDVFISCENHEKEVLVNNLVCHSKYRSMEWIRIELALKH